ncbi:thioester reductase domain-containing protein [Streptomyces sp. NPDC005732]|uniref:thioester reductase domain-containing protein n=1 Tax=Streptomyces sp. NPDC005732 TaxID=3157057 RepID=UPI0033D40C04
MREVNEGTSASAGRRAAGEAIERGDGGLSVAALLARTGLAHVPPASGASTSGEPDASELPRRGGTDVEPEAARSGAGAGAGARAGAGMVADTGTDVAAEDGTTHGTAPGTAHDAAYGTAYDADDQADSVPAAATPDVDGLASAIAEAAGPLVPGGLLSPDSDFFDAGGTSVGAVELVAALEETLGMELDLDEVFADARPRSLAERWLRTVGTACTSGTTAAPVAPEAPRSTASASASASASTSPPPDTTTRTPHTNRTPHTTRTPRRPTHRGSLPASDPTPSSAPPVRGARPEDLDQILADLALADRLPWIGPPEPLPPRRILLTGATGFLGGHLLLDLLRHSEARVYCLVRAADEEAATARLGAALRNHRLPWSSEVRRRVTVLPGDIRNPRLGLSGELWNTLAHELDSVVGVAAAVDFLRGYRSLRQSNVLGALTLAELAASGRPKPLHHISSIAVFNEVGITAMGEDDPLARVDRLVAGYDQTKWAAEVALRRARDHGLVVTALRPGGIGGHTRTGAYNPQDLSSGLLSAFGRFRTVPAFRHLNSAPVDWVSRVAAAVVCEPDAWGHDYHLTGVPNTLDDVVRDMAFGGLHVRVQDWDEWRADVLGRLDADPVPELGFLTRVLRSPTALKLCEATLTGPAATGERTAALVEALGLRPPARYDSRAQLRTFERLAQDGLARLPHRDDQPYLWFSETTEGAVTPVGAPAEPSRPCSAALTLSIASMHQLVRERRVDVRGELVCDAVHPEPLTVVRGDVWVRPEEGIPRRHGDDHRLLRYRLLLRDTDGGRWWLEGHKYARARRDVWRQTRALRVEIGPEGEPGLFEGELVVPSDSYVRDQIDGIEVDPRLTAREQRAAKLTWLAWFGLEMGRGLVGPFARAAADLLDLRRTPTPSERHR